MGRTSSVLSANIIALLLVSTSFSHMVFKPIVVSTNSEDIVVAQTYTLYVRVRDEGGNPIEGASVYLDGEFKGETNVEGELNILSVSEGTRTIVVKKEGYLGKEVTVNVTSNMTVLIVLELLEELPDLFVSSFEVSNLRVPEGQETIVSAAVENAGNGDAGGFSVSFRIDGNEFSSFSIAGLQTGESRVLEATWTAEGVGVHTISTLVDSNNDVKESYEGNNEFAQAIEVIPYAPDLVVKELSFEPSEPLEGGQVEFSVIIENIGVAAASGFYWSLEPYAYAQTKLTGYVSDELEAGCLTTVHNSFVYENAGRYNAVAVVDPGNEVEEVSEGNNALGVTITVTKIEFTFLYNGRMVISNVPIFGSPDEDHDTINDCWEIAATRELNPYIEFDEEEDMYQYRDQHPNDTVVNFVKVTPYPDKENPAFILFYTRMAFTRDYGRFGLAAHTGDLEKFIMAWKVLSETAIRLEWVFTGAHGKTETGHDAAWNPWEETFNTGSTCAYNLDGSCLYTGEDWMRSIVLFHNNRLALQSSEDKHALYPTCEVCEGVILAEPSVVIWPVFITGLLLDVIHGMVRVIAATLDALFGWINVEDDRIGEPKQIILTYEELVSGQLVNEEIHFRGGGAHYILYWNAANLGNQLVGDNWYSHIRVELNMLHCSEEMDWDQGSLSDEVYLMITGLTFYPEIDVWSVVDNPVVDQSVDSGDDCTEIFSQPTVVFDGLISEDWLIGFNVVLMEQDMSSSAERRDSVTRIRDEIEREISRIGISHQGDCDASIQQARWYIGIGEDCAGGRFLQIEAYNIGEVRREENGDLSYDLLPAFQDLLSGPEMNLTYFGFNEPIEGVDYQGKKRFAGGLSPGAHSPGSLLDSLAGIPSSFAMTLDAELRR